jgi:hypothetical protein
MDSLREKLSKLRLKVMSQHLEQVLKEAKDKNLSNHSQYQQILKDLEALAGITIKAVNAFWDNECKAYVDCTFHLFESVILYKGSDRGPANMAFALIKASDYLFNNSILKNPEIISFAENSELPPNDSR